MRQWKLRHPQAPQSRGKGAGNGSASGPAPQDPNVLVLESIRDDSNAHPSDRINAVKGLAALQLAPPWSVSVGTARRPEEQPVALPRCCPPRRHPASALRSRPRPGIRNPKVDGCEHQTGWARAPPRRGHTAPPRRACAPERLPGEAPPCENGTPTRVTPEPPVTHECRGGFVTEARTLARLGPPPG